MKAKIVFIDSDHKPTFSLTVNALTKKEAYIKAEEFYKVHEMKFKYTDMYIESIG